MEIIMPILHDFEYFKPASIDETLNLLSRYNNAAILAGGTDLVLNLKQGIATPEAVVDIKGIDELGEIEFKDGQLLIGALVTFNDLIESDVVNDKFPLIMEVSRTVGSMGIRNRATMVGNICSAVPCMDSGPLLCAYDADILVKGQAGDRKIPVSGWFLGNRETSIKEGEFVTGISIPFPEKKHAGCYVRLGRYAGEDLAQVSIAILAFSDARFRLAFGAVAPLPIRAKKIENLLNGKKLDDVLIEKAKEIIPEEIAPITDIRASKEYRMHTAKVMFERGIKAAVDRLNGGGPAYGTNLLSL
jgi:CO/xanthine dehydrogenase FAD-binding subunit